MHSAKGNLKLGLEVPSWGLGAHIIELSSCGHGRREIVEETERGQAPQHALLPVLSHRLAGRANIKTFPPSLSHRSMFCASHRTVVMAVAKSWKKLICQYPAG